MTHCMTIVLPVILTTLLYTDLTPISKNSIVNVKCKKEKKIAVLINNVLKF